jgi:hypothetical protein
LAIRRDGTEFFRINDLALGNTPLVADIDQAGDPEIVVQDATFHVVALSADGQTKEWTSGGTWPSTYGITPTVGSRM